MTRDGRGAQEVLADQFRITAQLSALTGEYHRLLQQVAAAGFARQMAEDAAPETLALARRAEQAAKQTAETCALQIIDLEKRLSALGRELAAST